MPDFFRKKPVVIEARRMPTDSFLTDEDERRMGQLADWCHGEVAICAVDGPCILIEALEGTMKATLGDWIIRGVQGEFYPCKPDIFAETYEPADPPKIIRWSRSGAEWPVVPE